MKTIRDVDVEDKTVLVRVDMNVPLENGEITSDFRLRASLPTLEYLREAGAAKIVLMTHLGRPEGYDEKFSSEVVAERLNELIGRVYFVDGVDSKEVAEKVEALKAGEILMLQNLRFYEGEKKNSAEFMQGIIEAVRPDVYVNDAFAVSHRAHASVAAVRELMPVYMGLLLEKEVENLSKVVNNPARPFVVIIGGAKVEDKEPLVKKFAPIADTVVVAGKIAADGYAAQADNIYVVEDFDEDAEGNRLDAGPLATAKIASLITDASTILWNGLLGKAEDPAFATASTIVAELMGEKETATTVVCGGDTVWFVEGLMEEHPLLDYTLLSTGGGAALEFLLGNKMPGLE